MKIIADIHIHSRYSRATSSRLTPESLERWARIKGIGLLGTGDCTHPAWLEELRGKLEDFGEGLYGLKESARAAFDAGPALAEGLPNPAASGARTDDPSGGVHFILSGEIATIYKKDGKVRKVHHVVILPDFKSAAAFNAKLERRGNIRSDGRPILGLDSADLLSMLLETDGRAVLVPAHIWTPWFSVLGAKSGFDSIEECYGALSSAIPAVETGLSSNPPMNWAVSGLDAYSIISNSDAHSPEKLGREAAILEMDLSFGSFARALRVNKNTNPAAPERIIGTIEFFPEEGKYHYDGHRNCKVSLDPEEAARLEGVCPVCGKPLTRGVLGRVLELADRPLDENASCPAEGKHRANTRPYYSLIPLREIVSELLETGGASKKVESAYGTLIEKAGNEFSILLDMPPEKIETLSCPGLSGELLAKAVGRMRRGEVSILPGYDGEYGVIRAFAPGEAKETGAGLFEGLFAEKSLAPLRVTNNEKTKEAVTDFGKPKKKRPVKENPKKRKTLNEIPPFVLDKDQRAAVSSGAKKALIIAGPGTGKTAVLAAKIAAVVQECKAPSSILAMSFTVKAAAELRGRISRVRSSVSGETEDAPWTSTFHSFCVSVLRGHYAAAGLPQDFRILGERERDGLLEKICVASRAGMADGTAAANPKERRAVSAKRLGGYIEERKRFLLLPGETPEDIERILPLGLGALISSTAKTNKYNSVFETLYREYRTCLRSLNFVDYDGLISGTVRLFISRKDILAEYRKKFRHIFVDEYQDINFAQYALIRLLVPDEEDAPSLWVIGDPNQAIYGFRGSDKAFIDRFQKDYPDAGRFELRKSFRCAEKIIAAAGRLAGTNLEGVTVKTGKAPEAHVNLFRREYPTEKSEAEGIARTIASLVGGTSFFAIDSGAAASGPEDSGASPGDFAILLRAASLSEPFAGALKDHGIPFEIHGSSVWWEEEPVHNLLDYLRERQAAVSVSVSPADEIRSAWETLKRAGAVSTGKHTHERIEQLVSLAGLFGGTGALLDGLALGGGIPDINRDEVKVMTIHASKGLEFDHVFVPCLEEGILPFTLYDRDEDTEEERRLLYVAMTRAKRSLWLSGSRLRNFRGRVLKSPPSRFLSELGNLVPLVTDGREYKRDLQMKLF